MQGWCGYVTGMTTLTASGSLTVPPPAPPPLMDVLSSASHAGTVTVAEVVGIVTKDGFGWKARTLAGASETRVQAARQGRWSGLRDSVAEWLNALDGEVVVVRCATEALRTVIAHAVRLPRFIVPSVTMLNRGLGWMAEAVTELHERIAAEALTCGNAPVLYAGTDGSAHPRHGRPAWSWVTHTGQFRTQNSTGNLLTAELGSIIDFACAHASKRCGPRTEGKEFSKAVLFSDSMQAVRILLTADASILSAFPSKRVAQTLRMVRSGALEVVWVRSHHGHLLNDVADRLAVLQHRQSWLKLTDRDVRNLAATIVEGMLPALASARWQDIRRQAHLEWREHDRMHPSAAVPR